MASLLRTVTANGAAERSRFVAKLLMKISLCKKVMGRYYYLAKNCKKGVQLL